MIQPTPYPDLNQVLDELVSAVQAALGENFLAAVLGGSFAIGDFDQFSDVDFIMVTRQALCEAEVQALQAVHARIYELPSPWAQHLEGSYFPQDVLRQWQDCSQKLWYIDNGARSLELSTHCNSLVERWALRAKGIALAGPPPAALIDPLPVEALRREIRGVIQDWGAEILAAPERYANSFYQVFIVLSYCRMLHSLAAGGVFSKRAGALWALAQIDPAWRPLVARSWARRLKTCGSIYEPPDAADYALTLAFVRYVMDATAAAP